MRISDWARGSRGGHRGRCGAEHIDRAVRRVCSEVVNRTCGGLSSRDCVAARGRQSVVRRRISRTRRCDRAESFLVRRPREGFCSVFCGGVQLPVCVPRDRVDGRSAVDGVRPSNSGDDRRAPPVRPTRCSVSRSVSRQFLPHRFRSHHPACRGRPACHRSIEPDRCPGATWYVKTRQSESGTGPRAVAFGVFYPNCRLSQPL